MWCLVLFLFPVVLFGRFEHQGFGTMPPEPTSQSVFETVSMFAKRSNAIIYHIDVPWKDLLTSNQTATDLLMRDQAPLIVYMRNSFNVSLFVTLDLTDGLDRAKEANQLIELNRSLRDPIVQRKYVEYASAVALVLKPSSFGLCAETNLIRALNPSVYPAVVSVVNQVASKLLNMDLYVSVNVEYAWGRLLSVGKFIGIDQDFLDFPWLNHVGLSCYPYLAKFDSPSAVPSNYFSIFTRNKRVSVVEGGWASSGLPNVFNSSETIQHDYFLYFADLDISGYFPGTQPPSDLLPFTTLGLAQKNLVGKAALSVWDEEFFQ